MRKLILGLSVFALVLPGVAMAGGAPTAFDQYSVASGDITSACPANFDCGPAIIGGGFMQRPITETATGTIYYQTILTGTDATGSPGSLEFSDENFIKFESGNSGGIASKSVINDAGGEFDATSRIDTGWAATTSTGGMAKALVVLSQNVVAGDLTGASFDLTMDMAMIGTDMVEDEVLSITQTLATDTFDATFTLDEVESESGAAEESGDLTIGQILVDTDLTASFSLVEHEDESGETETMIIDQTLDDSATANPLDSDFIKQRFVHVMTNADESGSMTLGDETVDWAADDEIGVVWVGQSINDGSGSMGDPSLFGFQEVENMETMSEAEAEDLLGTGPWDWNTDEFEAEPSLP